MIIKLDSPRDKDTHTLADFIELLCLIMPDGFCSSDLVEDHINDNSGKKIENDLINDSFLQFQWRIKAFDKYYPFKLIEKNKVLNCSRDFSESQKLYILLLLCANLPFLKKPYQDLTDAFERASALALKRIWPKPDYVDNFGKNITKFTGFKWEKLNQLSRKIGGKANLTENHFRPTDTGDGGIDLVAWLSLDSHEGFNIPSALAQCACSRSDWPKKQMEIAYDRLHNNLNPTSRWMELIFIPHSFRDNHGKWYTPGEIASTIVMDRLRILNCLSQENDLEVISSPDILKNFLNYKLDLV